MKRHRLTLSLVDTKHGKQDLVLVFKGLKPHLKKGGGFMLLEHNGPCGLEVEILGQRVPATLKMELVADPDPDTKPAVDLAIRRLHTRVPSKLKADENASMVQTSGPEPGETEEQILQRGFRWQLT